MGYCPCIPILDSFPDIDLGLLAPEPAARFHGPRELMRRFRAYVERHGVPAFRDRAGVLSSRPVDNDPWQVGELNLGAGRGRGRVPGGDAEFLTLAARPRSRDAAAIDALRRSIAEGRVRPVAAPALPVENPEACLLEFLRFNGRQ